MINVAIIEDDKSAVETLQTYLQRYTDENGVSFHHVWFNNAVSFLDNYKSNYDIVFLDIQLPQLNGMEAARLLRETDKLVTLIFVTNMAQYAIKGYEVDADDFIVKPVAYHNFSLKVKRVLKKINNREDIKLAVTTEGESKYISSVDIRYVEVMKHRLAYHTVDGVYEMRGSLREVELILSEKNFIRCNNYCMVNLRYVSGIKGLMITVPYDRGSKEKHDELMISNPRKKTFVKALNDYLGGNA